MFIEESLYDARGLCGQFAGFENDAISSCDRCCHLGDSGVDGVVPGRNDQRHTEWLVLDLAGSHSQTYLHSELPTGVGTVSGLIQLLTPSMRSLI